MKKIAIMQPYFFPYLGYWQLINAVDTFVLYDDVNFIKGGWINRNKILVNSAGYMLTLPLINSSSFSLIKDIKVTSNIKIKEKLLKTIEYNYNKAKYYNDVIEKIKEIILSNGSIVDVILESILWLKEYLNIETCILKSSEIEKDTQFKGQDKVIDIVKHLDGEQYINAIGGIELYDKEIFKNNGIDLKFIKMKDIKYKQYNNEFVPNLSIMDVLMFNPPEKIREMLDDYELL